MSLNVLTRLNSLRISSGSNTVYKSFMLTFSRYSKYNLQAEIRHLNSQKLKILFSLAKKNRFLYKKNHSDFEGQNAGF